MTKQNEMPKPDWQTADGRVNLYRGDCLEVIASLPAGLIDCTVTSPPYNQLENVNADSLTGMWGQKGVDGKPKGNFVNCGYFDGKTEQQYQADQLELFGLIASRSRPTASLFYNHQCRWRESVMLHPIQWFVPPLWRLRQEIIWDRCGGMMMNARMFCRFDERILWFDLGKRKWNQTAVGNGTVWRIPREQNKEHPVAFPLEVPFRCIEAATEPGDMVLDPYAGSATTLVAAMRLGCRAIGIEREPKYFDIAVRRIEAELNRAPLFEPPPIIQRTLIDAE